MMLGGGFLGQAHKSFKDNREMLKLAKSYHLEKSALHRTANKEWTLNEKRLSEADRILIVQRVFDESAKEKKRQMIALAVSAGIATGLLIAFLYYW